MNLTHDLAAAVREFVDVVAGRRAQLSPESADTIHDAIDEAAPPEPAPEPEPEPEPAAGGLEGFSADELEAAAAQLRAQQQAGPVPAADVPDQA